MVLENYVNEVSYVIAILIFTLFGSYIQNNLVIRIIRSLFKDSGSRLIDSIVGTILYILFAVFGVIIVKNVLIGFGIINQSNVNFIAIICFIALVIYLEENHSISR